jgi:hypothetical protein
MVRTRSIPGNGTVGSEAPWNPADPGDQTVRLMKKNAEQLQ